MKFLFLLNIGFDRAGPSVHLLQEVLRAALSRGHQVHVILKKTNGDLPVMPEEFCSNENFRFDCIDEDNSSKPGFIVRYLQEIAYAFRARKLFRRERDYDGVFLQSCNTALFYLAALRVLKCPVVFNVQDIFPYNLKLSGQLPAQGLSFPILRKLQNMAYQRASRIITISDDMKQTLVKDGVDPGKIDVVYNWSYADTPIRMETIPPENRKELMTGSGTFHVVYAGNIGKMQNVEIIAQAARLSAQDPSIRYYIIGEGANKARIEEMTRDLENVELLPMQPAKFAESIYAQASVNIIPLSRGGIFTALPSKTATCLRTDVPIIFCIDEDSAFCALASECDTVQIARCDDPADLLEKIRFFQHHDSAFAADNYSFFRRHFTTGNAARYVQVLEALGGK